VVADSNFTIRLDDGREAECEEADIREYLNCAISAGLVSGVGPDDLYFRFERPEDGEEALTIFMRPDEMLAFISVCGGALWLQQVRILELAGGEESYEDCYHTGADARGS